MESFIAVDFETAQSPYVKERFICQVGLVVVENNNIAERLSFLVQPEKNEYDPATIAVHHITPEMTANAPTFDRIWPEIEAYFINNIIVAHNARFDEDTLIFNLLYYFPLKPYIPPFTCTCDMFKRASLEALSIGFGLEYDPTKHHDALYDAERSAEFYIKYMEEEEPDWMIVKEITEERKKRREKKVTSKKLVIREPLSGDVLKQDLTGADPNNPFYDRKVVITGEFSQERKALGKILKSMGADVNTSISKKTHFVLVGKEPGPKKIETVEQINKLEHNGFHIQMLYQDDLDAILNGDWSSYYKEKDIIKDLDLTIEHYNKHHIKFDNNINIIASKELYYGKDLIGNSDLFKQICGNLGAFGDNEIYPETNICIISDSTLEKLKKGEKDETILYIQDYYNRNKSVTFGLTFLSESDILEYCKQRCLACGDELTMGYYEKYIKSRITIIRKQSQHIFKDMITIQEILNAESNYILEHKDDKCVYDEINGFGPANLNDPLFFLKEGYIKKYYECMPKFSDEENKIFEEYTITEVEKLVLLLFEGYLSRIFRIDSYHREVPKLLTDVWEILDSLLEKTPAFDGHVLYRFTQFEDKKDFKVGDIYISSFFLTTTIDDWKQEKPTYIITPLCSSKTSAKSLYKISNRKDENQVTFKRNSKFEITQIELEREEYPLKIYMSEIE